MSTRLVYCTGLQSASVMGTAGRGGGSGKSPLARPVARPHRLVLGPQEIGDLVDHGTVDLGDADHVDAGSRS